MKRPIIIVIVMVLAFWFVSPDQTAVEIRRTVVGWFK